MYIVFDIGGTKMRLGASRDGESIDKTAIIETPVSYAAGFSEFAKIAESLADGESIEAIAGGIAGPYDQKKMTLVQSTNLRDWVGRPFRSEMEKHFNAPVYIENDAAIVGLGEALRGAGREKSIVAYITGIGGCRIVNGNIDEKSIGFEPGHQIIDADRTMVPNSFGNLLGDYISGKGLENRLGKKPKDVHEDAFWDGAARILAYGLHNTCVFWSPDVIVLGGSMITGDPAIPLDKTREYLAQTLKIYNEIPEIREAELADLGGLHGALEYIRIQKNGSI